MGQTKEISRGAEYRNYRNIRAIAFIYIIFGSLFVLGGLSVVLGGNPDPSKQASPLFDIALLAIGIVGVVGGMATIKGNRYWSPLIYIMSLASLMVFPIGTLLSIIMFRGLSRYHDTVERFANISTDDSKSNG